MCVYIIIILQEPIMEPNPDDVEVWEFESDSESDHLFMTPAICSQSHTTVKCTETSQHVEISIPNRNEPTYSCGA